MQDNFAQWLQVFRMQRSEVAKDHGFGKQIIEEAGLDSYDDLSILIAMENRLQKAINDVRKEAQRRK